MKPIILYSHASGPNPWKVAMVMEELGIPYESKFIDLHVAVKEEPYISINPNGRVPAIVDPNTDLTLWESGAIIEYIIDTYDKEHKLSYASMPERYHTKQFLYFQASGQGPYYGQATWFRVFHPEDVPSAKKRYDEQIVRVVGVLDKVLEGREWLVGDKCTYADISFIPWDLAAKRVLQAEWEAMELDKKYPNFMAWHERLLARPAIKKTLNDQKAAQAASQ